MLKNGVKGIPNKLKNDDELQQDFLTRQDIVNLQENSLSESKCCQKPKNTKCSIYPEDSKDSEDREDLEASEDSKDSKDLKDSRSGYYGREPSFYRTIV